MGEGEKRRQEAAAGGREESLKTQASSPKPKIPCNKPLGLGF